MIQIYCLVDPRNKKPFYVGATKVKLKTRLSAHIHDAMFWKAKPWDQPLISDPKHILIKELIKLGLKPKIDLLYTCELITVEHYERFFYEILISQGFDLFNIPNHFNYLKYTKIAFYQYDKKYLK